MNLKKITIIIASLLFILATPASLAQPRPPYSGAGSSIIGPPPPSMEQGDKTVKFMKGSGDFEEWFMEAFTHLDTFIESYAYQASILGKAIGALGMLIYFSIIGFRMQSGSAEWDVEPMIKPVIIGLILIYWVPFTQMVPYPFLKLAEMPTGVFQEIEKTTNNLRTTRYTKQMQVLDATIKERAALMAKRQDFWTKVGNGDVGEAFGDQWDKLTAPIEDGLERLNYKMQKIIGEAIELVCLMILRVGVYLIFFIQKVWSYILIVLGPIAVGMSLIPGFESSLTNWVSKFININLYTFIAYTIINIGQQIIMAGYTMDITRLSTIVDANGNVINQGLLMAYTTYSGMMNSVIFPCVGYVITGLAVLMTPTIADSVVSAGGASIMTKAKGAASKAASAVSAGGKAVGGTVNAGRSLANSVKNSVANSTFDAVSKNINRMPDVPKSR